MIADELRDLMVVYPVKFERNHWAPPWSPKTHLVARALTPDNEWRFVNALNTVYRVLQVASGD